MQLLLDRVAGSAGLHACCGRGERGVVGQVRAVRLLELLQVLLLLHLIVLLLQGRELLYLQQVHRRQQETFQDVEPSSGPKAVLASSPAAE